MRNKKGQSAGYAWIYGLVSLFAVGILFIIFSQVFYGYLVPAIKNQVVSPSANIDVGTQVTIFGAIDQYMAYWRILPLVLLVVIVIYMFYAAVRKEGEQTQY